MKDIIIQKLNEIEEKENVKVIFAVESGSRAWGFDSADSGYKVRFIYLRNLESYLKLKPEKKYIKYDSAKYIVNSSDWKLSEKLDIYGVDLQKALCMLHKADPIFFEWANSPIVYKTSEQWEKIKEKTNDYFLLRREFFYYFNIAKSNYKLCLKKEVVKLKDFLYILYSILACKWITQGQSTPPMEFENLLDIRILQDNELKSIIPALIEMKRTSYEDTQIIKTSIINECKYIERYFALLKNIASTVKLLPDRVEKSYNELDKLFYDILINS